MTRFNQVGPLGVAVAVGFEAGPAVEVGLDTGLDVGEAPGNGVFVGLEGGVLVAVLVALAVGVTCEAESFLAAFPIGK